MSKTKEKIETINSAITSLQHMSNIMNMKFEEMLLNLQINKNNFVDEVEELKTFYDVYEKPFEVEKHIDMLSKEVIRLQGAWNDHVNCRLQPLNKLLDEAQEEQEKTH